jgi:hypothetical protein
VNDMLDWQVKEAETILWQGRPAPRCYTFRHWLQAAIGTIIFLACSFWLMVGIQLVKQQDYPQLLLLVPTLLVVGAFLVGPGQLILARMRWEKIFYALTDQRLLVRNRLFGSQCSAYPLDDFRHYKTKKYGKNLLSLKIIFRNRAPVILECLEYPELLLAHLPEKKRQVDQ